MGRFVLLVCILARVTTISPAQTITETFGIGANAFTMDFVRVGDSGNSNHNETLYWNGTVNYDYSIGKYEVTAKQYAAFLNSKLSLDKATYYNPNLEGLYKTSMDTSTWSRSIYQTSRSATPEEVSLYPYYQYAYPRHYMPFADNRPVSSVDFISAARFCNWLHNGATPEADTENGAYAIVIGSNLLPARNSNARFWIPSASEWGKAAYYDPNKNGIGAGGWWNYATMSDSPPDNQLNGQNNQANIRDSSGFSVTQSNAEMYGQLYTTEVGSYSASASAYGTYDQQGNVLELTDSPFSETSNVILLGGSFYDANAFDLNSYARMMPTTSFWQAGFRIASIPEPSCLSLLALGSLVMALGTRRPS
jgi:formylglycine-generating enzyme required for sulfatase activity